MNLNTAVVLGEVDRERAAQDQQWGGAEHDDQHRQELWDGLLWKFLRRAVAAERKVDERRSRLVQLAALAVAAIEVIDPGKIGGRQTQPVTVEFIAARSSGGSYDAAGRFRPRYYQVFVEGSRVAWLARLRQGTWLVARAHPCEPLGQGSMRAVRHWVRQHVSELAQP